MVVVQQRRTERGRGDRGTSVRVRHHETREAPLMGAGRARGEEDRSQRQSAVPYGSQHVGRSIAGGGDGKGATEMRDGGGREVNEERGEAGRS